MDAVETATLPRSTQQETTALASTPHMDVVDQTMDQRSTTTMERTVVANTLPTGAAVTTPHQSTIVRELTAHVTPLNMVVATTLELQVIHKTNPIVHVRLPHTAAAKTLPSPRLIPRVPTALALPLHMDVAPIRQPTLKLTLSEATALVSTQPMDAAQAPVS